MGARQSLECKAAVKEFNRNASIWVRPNIAKIARKHGIARSTLWHALNKKK